MLICTKLMKAIWPKGAKRKFDSEWLGQCFGDLGARGQLGVGAWGQCFGVGFTMGKLFEHKARDEPRCKGHSTGQSHTAQSLVLLQYSLLCQFTITPLKVSPPTLKVAKIFVPTSVMVGEARS